MQVKEDKYTHHLNPHRLNILAGHEDTRSKGKSSSIDLNLRNNNNRNNSRNDRRNNNPRPNSNTPQVKTRQGTIDQPVDDADSDFGTESDNSQPNILSINQLFQELITSKSSSQLKNTSKIFNRSLQTDKWESNPLAMVQSIAQTCYQMG